MYIPLEYWRRLEADPSMKRHLDGRAVTFDNVGRYLNNTSFSELVAGGWIGTTAPQTGILDPLIGRLWKRGERSQLPSNGT